MDKIDINNIKTDTKYQMLRVVLEANLELMKLAQVSTEEEKDIVAFSILKGLVELNNRNNVALSELKKLVEKKRITPIEDYGKLACPLALQNAFSGVYREGADDTRAKHTVKK